jgi:hypothetical protein
MPSAIGNIDRLVAVIQTQLSSRADLQSLKRGTAPGKGKTGQASRDSEGVEALIGERIKTIRRDDPGRGRKAFRVFLESILLSHFGENLQNDPGFYQLVDDVQFAMEADPSTSEMIKTAIAHLLS